MTKVLDNAFLRVLFLSLIVGGAYTLWNAVGGDPAKSFGYGLAGLPVAWIVMLVMFKASNETRKKVGYWVFGIITVMAFVSLLIQ